MLCAAVHEQHVAGIHWQGRLVGFDQCFGDRDLAEGQRIAALAMSHQAAFVTARDNGQAAVFQVGFGDWKPDGQDLALVGVVGDHALVLVPIDASRQAGPGRLGQN